MKVKNESVLARELAILGPSFSISPSGSPQFMNVTMDWDEWDREVQAKINIIRRPSVTDAEPLDKAIFGGIYETANALSLFSLEVYNFKGELEQNLIACLLYAQLAERITVDPPPSRIEDVTGALDTTWLQRWQPDEDEAYITLGDLIVVPAEALNPEGVERMNTIASIVSGFISQDGLDKARWQAIRRHLLKLPPWTHVGAAAFWTRHKYTDFYMPK